MDQRPDIADTDAARTRRLRNLPFFSAIRRLAGRPLLYAAIALIAIAPAGAPRASAPARVPNYRVTDLGPVAFDLGNNLSRYLSINDKGEVAGNWMPTPYTMHGYVWKKGHRTDVGVLPGYYNSRVLAINDLGVVVGYCEGLKKRGPYQKAFIWKNGKMFPIQLPKVTPATDAVAINDKNQIVLCTSSDTFLWQNGKCASLGVMGAVAINGNGEVVGTGLYHPGAGVGYAYVLKSKKPLDLGTLAGGWRSTAQDINNSGEVVGYCGVHFHSRAFLWNDNHLIDLSTEARSNDSVATWINNHGTIVGYAGGPGVYGAYSRAYLWLQGVGYNLNGYIPANSGWLLISADCINDRGQIVGFGHHDGKDTAYMLTPTS